MTEKPEYPDFKEMTLQDKDIFDEYLQKHETRASEFTFTNFFTWRKARNYEYTIYKEHLIVSYKEEVNRIFYQPVGETPDKIIAELVEVYPDSYFERVEKSVAVKTTENAVISHQRDMDDYVYLLTDLKELKGQKYMTKRNFVRRFEKNVPEVMILDKRWVSQCLQLQEEWCNMRNCEDDPYLKGDDLAVKEALTHFDALGLFGIVVVVAGKVEAFAIGEALNDDTFVEHFEKANIKLPGIYQYVLYQFVKKIPHTFTFINREQDLGIPGLRKAKKSYHPIRMIEKYMVKK